METGHEFAIAGNSPFPDHQLSDTGFYKILPTHEYIYAYGMWKTIADDECTWVIFKEHFQ